MGLFASSKKITDQTTNTNLSQQGEGSVAFVNSSPESVTLTDGGATKAALAAVAAANDSLAGVATAASANAADSIAGAFKAKAATEAGPVGGFITAAGPVLIAAAGAVALVMIFRRR